MARPRSPEKKEVIRKAAIRIIAEEGFHSCTTDKIAREAGVSVGTIYNYFSGKEDVLSYIFEIEEKKMDNYLSKFTKKKGINVPEKIRILLNSYFKYVFNNEKLTKLILDESNRPTTEVTEEIYSYLLTVREHVKKLLTNGKEEGTVNAEIDLDIMANMIIGSVNSIVFLGYIKPEKVNFILKNGPDNIYKVLVDGVFTLQKEGEKI
ncbi:MAG: TetR/AcrR family transcriptional regulator [Bacillota bacterium]